MLADRQNQKSTPSLDELADDWFDQSSSSLPPDEGIDELPTVKSSSVILDWSSRDELEMQYNTAIDEMATWILPIVGIAPTPGIGSAINILPTPDFSVKDHFILLRSFIINSGAYAIASVAIPLINLVLAPFLTHKLSQTDYGVLTILITFISLAAGITQMGLSSAFFRAYSYDYTSEHDRLDVLATITSLLCLISMLTGVAGVILAPLISGLLFGNSSLRTIVALSVGVVFLQNLTIPGFAWLRAESRALYYAILSICSVLITLIASLVLVGVLHMGIAGSLIATGSGYAGVVICTIPVIIVRAGIRIRKEIAKSVLAYGSPLILSLVSFWVLQLSDRYLLSFFGTLAETAKYAAAYTLGSAISVVVISPFNLAWPATMFAIAKREDAAQVFKLVFRWFSLFLLFAAFSLSFIGTVLLNLLFPEPYHSAAFVIPIIATSVVFFGIYSVFLVGANVTRKTWLTAVFTTIAAVVNIAFNIFLIPRYQAMGAAGSTLLAYIVLALVAYIVNQRIYSIAFEIKRFLFALLVGIGFYVGSSILASSQGLIGASSIYVSALALYGLGLVILARLPAWSTG